MLYANEPTVILVRCNHNVRYVCLGWNLILYPTLVNQLLLSSVHFGKYYAHNCTTFNLSHIIAVLIFRWDTFLLYLRLLQNLYMWNICHEYHDKTWETLMLCTWSSRFSIVCQYLFLQVGQHTPSLLHWPAFCLCSTSRDSASACISCVLKNGTWAQDLGMIRSACS